MERIWSKFCRRNRPWRNKCGAWSSKTRSLAESSLWSSRSSSMNWTLCSRKTLNSKANSQFKSKWGRTRRRNSRVKSPKWRQTLLWSIKEASTSRNKTVIFRINSGPRRKDLSKRSLSWKMISCKKTRSSNSNRPQNLTKSRRRTLSAIKITRPFSRNSKVNAKTGPLRMVSWRRNSRNCRVFPKTKEMPCKSRWRKWRKKWRRVSRREERSRSSGKRRKMRWEISPSNRSSERKN